jgi:hypothetical protein
MFTQDLANIFLYVHLYVCELYRNLLNVVDY